MPPLKNFDPQSKKYLNIGLVELVISSFLSYQEHSYLITFV